MPADPVARLHQALGSLAPHDEAAIEAAYPTARRGAVLAMFYPRDGEPHIALTRRTPTLRLHSGQISFPGGRIDPHDFSPKEAALRETREEIGIATDHLEVHGPLEPVFTVVSNFILLPFVGFAAEAPAFAPNPHEVAELIELPFGHLVDPATPRDEIWLVRGDRRRVGFYLYREHKIWGATARVLRQIIAMVGGPEPPSGLVPPGEVESLEP
jgi:8-oxo-dGTP pyrophosphatase MutT (NUDIX family)